MNLSFLIKGIILGFSIAAPVGPIGILCIRRTLTSGMICGFVSGIGAATADAFYGCITAFGITAIAGFLLQQQFYTRLIGSLFLMYLGLATLISKPAEQAKNAPRAGIISSYSSTFFLTITNPMTIISFTAIFAGLGVGHGGKSYLAPLSMVAGVFIGSMLWWLILSSITSVLCAKLNFNWLKWINRLSGMTMIGFAAINLYTVL